MLSLLSQISATLQLTPQQWRIFGFGCGLAWAGVRWGQIRFLLAPLVIIIHELGHAATGWVFGYPSIPAFDFLYGGGITLNWGRWSVLIWAVYVAFGYLFWRYRQRVRVSQGLLALFIGYTLFVTTGLHNLLIVAMGHGAELGFAAWFLWKGLSGKGCKSSGERTLYCAVGWFIVLYDLQFAHSLLTDPEFRAVYELGKGEVLDHDLVRLARDLLHVPFTLVVLSLGLCCGLTPVLAVIAHRYSGQLRSQFKMLLNQR